MLSPWPQSCPLSCTCLRSQSAIDTHSVSWYISLYPTDTADRRSAYYATVPSGSCSSISGNDITWYLNGAEADLEPTLFKWIRLDRKWISSSYYTLPLFSCHATFLRGATPSRNSAFYMAMPRSYYQPYPQGKNCTPDVPLSKSQTRLFCKDVTEGKETYHSIPSQEPIKLVRLALPSHVMRRSVGKLPFYRVNVSGNEY